MLCCINLSYSISSCTYTKATILEQNILLQNLANVGVAYVRLRGVFEFFVVVYSPLISIKPLLALVTRLLTYINNMCSFFFTS